MPLPEHLAELERRVRERFDAAVEDLRRQYEARLRQSHEETLAALTALRPTATDPFEGLDPAALELQPRGAERAETLAALVAGARAIDRSASQTDTLEALLSSARRFVARAGLLLVRVDALVGWGSIGFDGDPFAGRELDWDDALLSGLASGRGAVLFDGAPARSLAERLGVAAAPGGAALVPLVLRDRIAAALYADAEGGAESIPLGALQLLVQLAAAHLELSALGERTFTPTLYGLEEAPAVGLALWSPSATAEAPPAPAAEPPALPVPELAAVAAEPPAIAPEPEPEVAPAAAEVAAGEPPELDERAEVEGLFVAEKEERPEPPDEMPPAETPAAQEPAAAPGMDDSFWGMGEGDVDAGRAGFAVGPEPEAAPEPAFEAAPEPQAPREPESRPPAAVSEATVRIPAFRTEPPAPPAPPDEAPEQPPAAAAPEEVAAPEPTAPAEETSGALGFSGTTTQEVPRIEAPPPAAAPPAEAARDTTEDATLLMDRPASTAPTAPTPAVAAAAPAAPPDAPATPPKADSEDDTVERTGTRGGARTTEVVAPPDVSGPGLAFAAGRAARSSGDNALHDEARRLARLLVSEIKLYNEEQVLEGRRNRDLYVRLREDIDRSRQIYEERVHESVRETTDYFHQELVRSLAGGDARALGM